MSTMKTLVYGQTVVELATKKIPASCKKSEVLVRVKAAGLNPVDAKHVIGDKLPASWTSTHTFVNTRIVKNNIIGFEFSGEVVACPSGVYSAGDEVFGTMPPFGGTLAEYVVAPLHHVNLKPASLTFEQAAALPLVGLTCVQALAPHQDSCKSIAVVGASGGTGHMVIQVARCMGFTDIVAVCSSRNKEFVQELGATRVVCYDKEDVVSGLTASGRTHDIIFDCVTSADPRDSIHEYPKKLLPLCKTRYLRLGGESSDWIRAGLEKVTPFNFFGKEKLFWIRFPRSHDELMVLKNFCDDKGLAPKLSMEVGFTAEAVQAAFDAILQRRVQGKIAVKVSEG